MQMDPAMSSDGNPSDSLQTDLNDPRATEDGGREDTFVDCPDEIENSESNQTSEEKNGDDVQNDQYVVVDDDDDEADSGIKLPESIAENEVLVDQLDRSAFENERLARENEEEEKVRELQSILYTKDQEIDFLNAKIAELTNSTNPAQPNSQLYELQLEKDQQIEEITNRMLSLLTMVGYQEELLDGSLAEKIYRVEMSLNFLVEKHNRFVSESDQLKCCLKEIGLDFSTIDEIGALIMARDKIFELRRNEEERLRNLGDENGNVVEQLEKQRSTIENLNAEIGRLSAEVEQERNRHANTKEKLSLAVTKGKALVQKRDSMKQLLAEKTSQMEKLSLELQEKSIALEAAEKTKELVVAGEILAASLGESLVEKDTVLEKCREILSESVPEKESQPTDITDKLRWLTDENKSLRAISLQCDKVTEALMSCDFPETVASSGLDVRVRWLAEYFSLLKDETVKLRSEEDKTKEAAYREIDHLITSLSAEVMERGYLEAELDDLRKEIEANERLQLEFSEEREAVNNEIERLRTAVLAESQEKSNLQAELEYLRHEHEGVVRKEYSVSLEKDKIVNMMIEASGLAYGGDERVHGEESESDLTTIIENCLSKIKENSCRIEPAPVDWEKFESFKSLLYIRDQEMSLYKLIIEEDVIVDRQQVIRLSDELEMKVQELNALKDENAFSQRSREQLEDRCALLKEKLSMAVKKGKGLVQERENLKSSLDEKKTEIDRLKSERQEILSKYSECQDQITKLSLGVERISVLEADLFTEKERGDQLEQFLAERNRVLQKVMESIDVIPTPTDVTFKDPVEKVKWVCGHLSEVKSLQMEAEKELQNARDEASSLACKLSEVGKSLQSTEDALSAAENSRSQISDEKKELEAHIAFLEEELQREKERSSFQESKIEEFSANKEALEKALSLAEDNISRSIDERNIAVESRALAEEHLQKIKEEFANQITKLADAQKTIQSLEDALFEAQKNITLLSEENSQREIFRADFDNEIKNLREEADQHARKLSEASITIKSLEDALSNAQNNIEDLAREKTIAKEEIMELKGTLESRIEELAETRDRLENELSGQLSRLHLLLEDETLPSLLGQCFERKFESLNSIGFLLGEIGDYFAEMNYDVQQQSLLMEGDSPLSDNLPSISGTTFNMGMLNDTMLNAADNENLVFRIEKMTERFQLKSKIVAEKFDSLSTLMDGSIAAIVKRFRSIKDQIISIIKHSQFLKQEATDISKEMQRKEEAVASLQMENRTLLSACNGAIQELELNARKNLEALISIHDYVNLDGIMSMDLVAVGDGSVKELANDHMKMTDRLLLATRQNEDLNKLFQKSIEKLMSITQDLQNERNEIQVTCDGVLKQRVLDEEKIAKMEADLRAQHNMCVELTFKLDEYEAKEDEWRKKEMELSSSLTKFRDSLLSSAQMKLIFDKVNEIEVPDDAFQIGDSHDPASIRKLSYVLDSYNESQEMVTSLSSENEELLSTIDQQILEIEHLKKNVEKHLADEKDSEGMKALLELESGLWDIVRNLVGNDMTDGHVVDHWTSLLPLLDKLITAKIHESESLKSKNEELSVQLLGTQKVVGDLSNKVKFLEDSNQAGIFPPEINQERTSTSIASLSTTQSEISEMQDVAALGKNSDIVPVHSAAHVRTLRKGSNEHLAISIDSESERFMNNKESDEDKGHTFKSLNNSGLIPRQGRRFADRVDGIW
ncbi:TGN-localized SYP41-interacting protein [Striga asiatica]|uniref:TGN-localized SYP41-interacting protein n=1 Tax=Striga asiatica TaxID=4170 RepID=A0A5A7NYN7_STRAF|nr:TGN-localized SYP41-interacting protein [Striga asiatica]